MLVRAARARTANGGCQRSAPRAKCWELASKRALAGIGAIVPVVLDRAPARRRRTPSPRFGARARRADALIAVGSGTINDLCKYAAAQDGKPYVVFATAPSMNGYTSMNAAITVDGHKKSLPAATPLGVFIDLEVLAAAPARMIRAGLGDSLCRPTAQADWLLSHHLVGTPYRSAPFALLADDESTLFDAPEALAARRSRRDARARAHARAVRPRHDASATAAIPRARASISSATTSTCTRRRTVPHYFHGEQVAVTTLTMARIQEEMLAAGPPRLQPSPMTEAELQHRLGPELGASCWKEFLPKRLTPETAPALAKRVGDDVERALHEAIRATSIPAERLASIMQARGRPDDPCGHRASRAVLRRRGAQRAIPARPLHVPRPRRRRRVSRPLVAALS